jgi:hypothetical protein
MQLEVLISCELAPVKESLAGLQCGFAGLQSDVAGLRRDVASPRTSFERLQEDVSGLHAESAYRSATHLLGPLYVQPAMQQSLAQLVGMLPLREDEDVLQHESLRLARTLRASEHLLQQGIPQKLLSALEGHLQVRADLSCMHGCACCCRGLGTRLPGSGACAAWDMPQCAVLQAADVPCRVECASAAPYCPWLHCVWRVVSCLLTRRPAAHSWPPQVRGSSTGGPWLKADGSLDQQAVGQFLQQETDGPLRCAVSRLPRDLLRLPAQHTAEVGCSGLPCHPGRLECWEQACTDARILVHAGIVLSRGLCMQPHACVTVCGVVMWRSPGMHRSHRLSQALSEFLAALPAGAGGGLGHRHHVRGGCSFPRPVPWPDVGQTLARPDQTCVPWPAA